MAKQQMKGDAGKAAQAFYEKSEPAGQPGRYPYSVDLNAKTSTESVGGFKGRPSK